MRGLLIVLLALSACQLPLGRAGTPGTDVRQAPATSPVETFDLVRAERAVLDGVNRARTERELQPMRPNAAMAEAAREHAMELAARGELDHASVQVGRETFAKRLSLAGAPEWTLAGENLMMLPHPTPDVAADAVLGWLGSASHRTQMLEPGYSDTGVGIARDARGDWYIVQLFVRRR